MWMFWIQRYIVVLVTVEKRTGSSVMGCYPILYLASAWVFVFAVTSPTLHCICAFEAFLTAHIEPRSWLLKKPCPGWYISFKNRVLVPKWVMLVCFFVPHTVWIVLGCEHKVGRAASLWDSPRGQPLGGDPAVTARSHGELPLQIFLCRRDT